MKKSVILRKLATLLKQNPTPSQILALVQKEGMQPPFSKQMDTDCECGCHGTCPKGHEWDSEHLPKDANPSWRCSR